MTSFHAGPAILVGSPRLTPQLVHVDRIKFRLRLSRCSVGQGWERFRRHRLVPISDARKVEVETVSVSVFDARPQALFKSNRVFEMEPVHVGSPQPPISWRIIPLARRASGAEVGVHVNFVRAPALVKVVLRAGSVSATRPRFTVDHEHVIALAVPNRGVALDVVIDSNEVAATGWFAEHIVVGVRRVVLKLTKRLPLIFLTRAVFRSRDFLVVPSVEAGGVFGQRRMVFVVDVVVKVLHVDIGIVFQRNPGILVKRHREVADERSSLDWRRGERERLIDVTRSPPLAEEVSDRSFDAGVFLVVPIHAKDEVTAAVGVVVVEGAPDVGDDARVVHRREGDGSSGGNWNVVAVAASAVITRNSVRRSIDELGDIRQRTLTHFGDSLLKLVSIDTKVFRLLDRFQTSSVCGKIGST